VGGNFDGLFVFFFSFGVSSVSRIFFFFFRVFFHDNLEILGIYVRTKKALKREKIFKRKIGKLKIKTNQDNRKSRQLIIIITTKKAN